jgi:hypothetical protein
MIAALLLASLSLAFGATDSSNAFEKSFARDNTFCSFKGKRVELLIRGASKFVEPVERGYGELLFYRYPGKAPHLLPLTDFTSDTYRLLLGRSPGCSKSHGHPFGSDRFAVLLLRENRPFPDKLAIQLFDAETLAPKELVGTEFLADRAAAHPEGFAFREVSEPQNTTVGKVTIAGATYISQEKSFPRWYVYAPAGARPLPELTYEKFPWRKLFADKDEFLALAGWNPERRRFDREVLRVAVNYGLQRRCFLFTEAKRALTGTETWKCQAM